MSEDAVANGGGGARAGSAAAVVVFRMGASGGADGAGPFELGEHGGGDSDVGAAVEKVVHAAAEVGRPSDGDGEVADGRTTALGDDGVDDFLGVGGGVGVVVGVQVGQIADEVLVVEAELGREGLDQVVIRVDATRQDEG